ncbi:M48 family metalloprotease [Allorhizocola rhizosphaerae]|uniref:M48 family metalloprotease n=1 Tax=Allorhizocola rhizosphaerae TaxID=1872709 RepID=UPI000E3BD7D3|nr:M48 family metallopeptidase [Allorhizocola rhizosphaerae]
MTIVAPTLTDLCPRCHSRLVTEGDATPWCGRCLWNLDWYQEEPGDGWLARRIGRLDHTAGYDLSIKLYESLRGKRIERPTVGAATLWLALVSGLLLAAIAGLAALGVWLIVAGAFLMKPVGVLLLLLAWLLRPRLGRLKPYLDEYDEVTRDRAPHLFALVDEAAAATGAPAPHVVLVGAAWDAFGVTVGLRRRRVLMLGLPLWASLRPQERVAVLAHEMGHFANGDLRIGLATSPALQTFGILADVLHQDRPEAREDLFIQFFAEWAARPFLLAASHTCRIVHMGLNAIGARQAQRAEYYADELAVRVGGSAAVLGALDALSTADGLTTVIGARSRSGQRGDGWREGVEKARANLRDRFPTIRQLTIRRDASLFASHPPAGLRHAVVGAGAHRAPAIVLSDARAAAIDAELSTYEERHRRVIAASW